MKVYFNSKNIARTKTAKANKLLLSVLLSLIAIGNPLAALSLVSSTAPAVNKDAADPGINQNANEQTNDTQQNTAPQSAGPEKPTVQFVNIVASELKRQIYSKGLGLNAADLHLVNQGQFDKLADNLSTKINYAKVDRNAAWLAFSYLYLQKCQDLNQLLNSYGVAKTSDEIKPGTDINLVLIQAFACLCEKKTDLAEKILQTIPAAGGKDAFVNYAFATLAGKKGKTQEAIAYCQQAVTLAPDFAWSYRAMAFLQEKWLNQPVEAKTNYTKALEIEPKMSEASAALIALCTANNEYDQAIAIAKAAITHNPRRSANYRQLANIYIQQWRLQEAAQELRKAIAIDPQDNQYYRQLAFILHKEGNLPEAVNIQKKAVDCSSDKSADLVELAWLQLADGKQNEAVESLKQAIDANAENMTAVSDLTRLCISIGKFDELVSELNKCAAKSPKNALIKVRLGDALVAAKQPDKAIEAYKEAANLNLNDAEPHTKVAALLIARKDYEGAAKEYTRALNINSNSVASLVALGACEALMDDYLKAEAAFVTALALHQLTVAADSTVPPTRADVIKGLAALLYKEGRYADASSQFMAVIEVDKNTANAGLNKFMTAQAIALRDLSKESAKQLDIAYSALSDTEKKEQKINYTDTLLRAGRFDEALALLTQKAAASDSTASANANTSVSTNTGADPLPSAMDPFYYICLSRAYLGKGSLDKAEEAANQALAICEKDNSPHSDTYCQLAQVALAKADYASAETNANAAIGVNSKAFRAYIILGDIALKQKQYKLATEAANKALEINPYFIDAYLLLGQTQTAQGDLKASVATYNKAADLYSAYLPTHELLLSVLSKTGTKEEMAREQAVIAGLKSKQ